MHHQAPRGVPGRRGGGRPAEQRFRDGARRGLGKVLRGKVALVTGGSRGTGAATARMPAGAGRTSRSATPRPPVLAGPQASFVTGAVLDVDGGSPA
ncbi:hypothetical protein [Streptomyces caatingaensis]|uniref:hypothetical protein n=1 Tax=Streptomyces caatingaensis TaxID=1678637 RepID=UPI00069CE915|nr:hypothetical protein [Streptomyces caatingaensis]